MSNLLTHFFRVLLFSYIIFAAKVRSTRTLFFHARRHTSHVPPGSFTLLRPIHKLRSNQHFDVDDHLPWFFRSVTFAASRPISSCNATCSTGTMRVAVADVALHSFEIGRRNTEPSATLKCHPSSSHGSPYPWFTRPLRLTRALTWTTRMHPRRAPQARVHRTRQKQQRQEGGMPGERSPCVPSFLPLSLTLPSPRTKRVSFKCQAGQPRGAYVVFAAVEKVLHTRVPLPFEWTIWASLWVSRSSSFECGSLLLKCYVLYFSQSLILLVMVVVFGCRSSWPSVARVARCSLLCVLASPYAPNTHAYECMSFVSRRDYERLVVI